MSWSRDIAEAGYFAAFLVQALMLMMFPPIGGLRIVIKSAESTCT